MSDRLERLESAVASVAASVARLEDRVAALEVGRRALGEGGKPAEFAGELTPASAIESHIAAALSTPTLIGRSFLVLAGAFLLRVLTERDVVAPVIGVTLGVAYAMTWIVMAALAARRGSRASSAFYAACSAVIAGPLLFEAATSFAVLSPVAAIVVLAVVTAAGLVVSVRWRLEASAGVFVVTCSATAVAVATARPPGETATAVVILLGIVVFWFGHDLRWTGLIWVTAFSADLAVLRLTTMACAAGELQTTVGTVHPTIVSSIQALLVFGYIGTSVFRALRGRIPTRVIDFVQTAAVCLVGWGGALRLAEVHERSVGGLAFIALLSGAAAYAGAFGVVDRRQGRNAAFVFLSFLGLGLVLVGLPGLAGGTTAVLWSGLAVAAAAAGVRWDRVTLRIHAAVLAAASWIAGGMVSEVTGDLTNVGVVNTTSGMETVQIAVQTLGATAVIIIGRKRRAGGWMERLPMAILLFLSALAVAAAMVVAAREVLTPGVAMGAGTVAMSLVTVGLAALAKRLEIPEAGWLVYPFLALTGLRMVVRDVFSGQTLVLVIALAAYGFALIASTKMVGLRPAKESPSTGP